MDDIAALPGFRRRFIITPRPGVCHAALEDDYHHMTVALRHDGAQITGVESEMIRAPWTTCPGAKLALAQTFTGQPLSAARRDAKTQNCTHLYDLVQLAALHAGDAAPTTYDILVSDPVDGHKRAEIRRDGTALLSWGLTDGDVMTAPETISGLSLFALRDWIVTLPGDLKMPARMLQWGTIMSHGRRWHSEGARPEGTANAIAAPGACYSFQPDRLAQATHIGSPREFSTGGAEPLAEYQTGRL